MGHAAVRSDADGLRGRRRRSPVGVLEVACDNAETLMHAAASGRRPISCSIADGASIAARDRRPRLEDSRDDDIREFKIGEIRSSAKVLVGRTIGKPQGLGSDPGEPRFLSNPPLQRTGARSTIARSPTVATRGLRPRSSRPVVRSDALQGRPPPLTGRSFGSRGGPSSEVAMRQAGGPIAGGGGQGRPAASRCSSWVRTRSTPRERQRGGRGSLGRCSPARRPGARALRPIPQVAARREAPALCR